MRIAKLTILIVLTLPVSCAAVEPEFRRRVIENFRIQYPWMTDSQLGEYADRRIEGSRATTNFLRQMANLDNRSRRKSNKASPDKLLLSAARKHGRAIVIRGPADRLAWPKPNISSHKWIVHSDNNDLHLYRYEGSRWVYNGRATLSEISNMPRARIELPEIPDQNRRSVQVSKADERTANKEILFDGNYLGFHDGSVIIQTQDGIKHLEFDTLTLKAKSHVYKQMRKDLLQIKQSAERYRRQKTQDLDENPN